MPRVFEVRGAAGAIDGVENAFNAKVEALSNDPRVVKMSAEVLTDGERETVLGPQLNIVGYVIDVEYADEAR